MLSKHLANQNDVFVVLSKHLANQNGEFIVLGRICTITICKLKV